jgi:hypothetical protein
MQATDFGQDLQGGLLETVATQTKQADDTFGTWGKSVRTQAGLVIKRELAKTTATTVVVAAAVVDGAQQTLDGLGTVTFESGCLLTVRASYAGPLVAVFF